MKRIPVITVVSLVLLMGACRKDQVTLKIAAAAPQFTVDSFPIKVGNWWRYEYINFNYLTIDTLTLNIVSLKTINGERHYTFLEEIHAQIMDTVDIILSDSLISYSGTIPQFSYFGNFSIKLPFKTSSTWYNNDSILDSTKVISYDDSILVNGEYYKEFFLKRVANTPNYSAIQTISISPKIGIVQNLLNLYQTGMPSQRQNLRLIDYYLQ